MRDMQDCEPNPNANYATFPMQKGQRFSTCTQTDRGLCAKVTKWQSFLAAYPSPIIFMTLVNNSGQVFLLLFVLCVSSANQNFKMNCRLDPLIRHIRHGDTLIQLDRSCFEVHPDSRSGDWHGPCQYDPWTWKPKSGKTNSSKNNFAKLLDG